MRVPLFFLANADKPIWKLRMKGTTLMTGLFISDSREETVHGKVLQKGFAKYQILNCYIRSLMKWDDYDPDKHVSGSYVAWPKNKTKKRSAQKTKSRGEESPTKKAISEGEKKILPPCQCRLKCFEKITSERRHEIHHEYWDFKYNARRTWILKNVKLIEPKRRKKGAINARKNCRDYHLDKVSVCKKMFMNTLGYTADKFITIALKAPVAESTRGKHDHAYHSIKPEDEKIVEEHVLSYEPGISHYRREHAPHRLYVDPSLTISDMYKSYKKQREQRK